MTVVNSESRFAGVIKIIRFNIQFYAISLIGLVSSSLVPLAWGSGH